MLIVVFGIVISLLLPIILGLCCIKLFFPKSFDSLVARSAFAFGIGIGLITWIEFIFLCAGLRITLVNFGSALLFIISVMLLLLAKRKKAPYVEQRSEALTLVSKILLSLIIIQCVWVIVRTFNLPFIVDDAVEMWGLRAKLVYFYNLRGDSLVDIAGRMKYTHNGNYPMLISLALRYVNLFIYGWNDLYPKIIFPVFYISLLATFFYSLKQFSNRNYAMIFSFLLSGLAFMRGQATWATADLAFSFYYCTSVFLMFLWMKNYQNRYIYLSALFAVFSIWTKNEGYPSCMINFIIVVIFMAGKYNDRVVLKKLARGLAGFVAIVLPVAFIIIHYQSLTGVREGIINSQALSLDRLVENFGRIVFILNKFQQQMFGALNKWNILGYALVIACLLHPKKILRPPYLYMFLVVFLNFALYVTVFMLTPINLDYHMNCSQNRMLLHFVPVMVFLLATLLYDKETIG